MIVGSCPHEVSYVISNSLNYSVWTKSFAPCLTTARRIRSCRRIYSTYKTIVITLLSDERLGEPDTILLPSSDERLGDTIFLPSTGIVTTL